jgi:hypothetical protein
MGAKMNLFKRIKEYFQYYHRIKAGDCFIVRGEDLLSGNILIKKGEVLVIEKVEKNPHVIRFHNGLCIAKHILKSIYKKVK